MVYIYLQHINSLKGVKYILPWFFQLKIFWQQEKSVVMQAQGWNATDVRNVPPMIKSLNEIIMVILKTHMNGSNL